MTLIKFMTLLYMNWNRLVFRIAIDLSRTKCGIGNMEKFFSVTLIVLIQRKVEKRRELMTS